MLVLAPSGFAQSGSSNTKSPPATLVADPHIFPRKINGKRVYQAKEVAQKVRVISKPEPEYNTDARDQKIEGTVVLSCVFDSTGQVTFIKVVSGLPWGLNESAIAVAKKIQFTPALKNGHPVPTWMELQYNFHL
jgi:TonB family protein